MYLPLTEADKERMLERFVSVTRATLKGTVLIGIAQGALGGLAVRAAGIDGAIFWGTVMTVLHRPGHRRRARLGSGLAHPDDDGGGLARGCAGRISGLVIGSIDNLLWPLLVGRDTQMHELMIFFRHSEDSMMFGVMGFIVGPSWRRSS